MKIIFDGVLMKNYIYSLKLCRQKASFPTEMYVLEQASFLAVSQTHPSTLKEAVVRKHRRKEQHRAL